MTKLCGADTIRLETIVIGLIRANAVWKSSLILYRNIYEVLWIL